MFDFGITEMMIIAVVGLIVIGPERLPRAARTLGHLFGRMQRYVGEIKADINREVELDELRKLQASMKEAAQEIAGFDLSVMLGDDPAAIRHGDPLSPFSHRRTYGPGNPLQTPLENRFAFCALPRRSWRSEESHLGGPAVPVPSRRSHLPLDSR